VVPVRRFFCSIFYPAPIIISWRILNKSDLAAPLGMSVPGITRWIGILEATCQILVIPPYFENLGKRLVKSPKVYIADSGLACHLLGIRTVDELTRSPFLGTLFEGLIASEIVKAQENSGTRRELYFFRDQQSLEVDFVLPCRDGHLTLVEVKASATVRPEDAGPLCRLADAIRKSPGSARQVDMFIVHQQSRSGTNSYAVAPGVNAMPWTQFVQGDPLKNLC
jgi:uncharacterized protein